MSSTSYRESHTSTGKGASYEDSFRDNRHRAVMWRLEQQILDRIVAEHFSDGERSLLDFACGTGRILHYLERRFAESVGVDLSVTMLEVARSKVQQSQVIEADITRSDVLGDRKFDLITAFRFFPNAEPELRSDAIHALVNRLSANGLIVFNNHKHSDSSVRRLIRLLGRDRGRDVFMSAQEASGLIRSAGLVVVKRYHLGVIPVTEKRPLLPSFVLHLSEDLLSRCAPLSPLARTHIYVCKRAN